MVNISRVSTPHNGHNLKLFPALVTIVLIGISIIGVFVSLVAILHNGYNLMFLLPIMFVVLLFMASNRLNEIPSNLGFTLIIGLEFIRLVVVPILFVVGDYPETITYNSDSNNLYGIMLQIYEVFWIGFALNKQPNKKRLYQVTSFESNNAWRKFVGIVIVALIITAGICIIAPEILSGYRLITMANDEYFTYLEQSHIVNENASSTFKKLFLVIANYILKPMRLIVPAFLMHMIYRYSIFKSWTKPLSLFLALSPFIFVDGTIARSLYFSIVLLLFYNKLYGLNMKRVGLAISAGGLFIVGYWIVRYNSTSASTTTSMISYFGEKLNDYFCGFNIVGAVGSLPEDIGYRIKYFIQDYIRCIPFANTIFGLDANDTIRVFFNLETHAPNGQIPATLAMGCYYFTPLFAPLYSYMFTRLAINFGNKAKTTDNPYYVMIWSLSALYFALGIAANDVSVTLSNYVQVILPVYLMIKAAYPFLKGEKL